MPRGWVLVALLFVVSGSARTDEEPSQSLTTEQAADAVVVAFQSEDRVALQALAAKDQPDPWLVVDGLCFRSAYDAASAFAKAAPRPAVEELAAYVEARRGNPSDTAARTVLGRAHAARVAGQQETALAVTHEVEPDLRSVVGIHLLYVRAEALRHLRRLGESAEVFLRVAEAARELGWLSAAGTAYHEAAASASWSGDLQTALTAWQSCLEVRQKIGQGIASTLSNLGTVHDGFGNYPKALTLYEQALEICESQGNERGIANIVGNIAITYWRVGDLARALTFQRRALALLERRGDRLGVAASLGNLGLVYHDLGDYAQALAYHERALELRDALGDPRMVARTLSDLGSVYFRLGDPTRALAYYERSLSVAEDSGDASAVGTALGNIGMIYRRQGATSEALTYHERAHAIAERLGERGASAQALANIALLLADDGDYEGALEYQHRALTIQEEIRERRATALTLLGMGWAYTNLGRRELALDHLQRAVRVAMRARASDVAVRALTEMARFHLVGGNAAEALQKAHRALREAETLIGGLGEVEGATARAEHASVFAVGALAAARLARVEDVALFLESGRAGALLESLGGRRALRWTDLPAELREAEDTARAAENRARYAHDRALDAGVRQEIRVTGQSLDEARTRVGEVAARIQREAKRQAGLLYPRMADLSEIQAGLEEGTALVLYGLCLNDALALVVTPDEARVVSLGAAAPITGACEALQIEDAEGDPGSALTRLRDLLVGPLALPDTVASVLVSPEGPFSYLPFGALFGNRVVAITPSGTTHLLLAEEERGPGQKVLALGDPDYGAKPDHRAVAVYRSGKLLPLPATRAEANAVADVVLLGQDATEAKLATAIAKRKRWRAVHLACHGLVDPERPTLSSLALTRAGDDDGFLTALEVLRMEIPADLVVLSACETAKGQVVKGEGIVGLTRAFMYAGAPRVLCSLWEVDDEATQFLMVKFYESWTPKDGSEGMGAAAALRAAQVHVRSQEKWAHPYYWAAWVLWGLPK